MVRYLEAIWFIWDLPLRLGITRAAFSPGLISLCYWSARRLGLCCSLNYEVFLSSWWEKTLFPALCGLQEFFPLIFSACFLMHVWIRALLNITGKPSTNFQGSLCAALSSPVLCSANGPALAWLSAPSLQLRKFTGLCLPPSLPCSEAWKLKSSQWGQSSASPHLPHIPQALLFFVAWYLLFGKPLFHIFCLVF